MMKEKTVSVIIPVYNPGDCLEKCINSLLTQTYKKLEIILVNDASSDGSDIICKKFAESSNLFKYIEHKENKGQTITRNDGVAVAEGEWLIFLDSDDYFEPDALSFLVEASEKYKSEIVLSNYKTVKDNGIETTYTTDLKEGLYSTKELLNSLFTDIRIELLSCIGTKLYRNNFIKNKKPKTADYIKTNYDLAFILDALSANPNIAYVNRVSYVYYQHAGSITYSYRNNMFLNVTKARERFLPLLKENGCYESKKLSYHMTRYATITWSLGQEITFKKGYKHFKEVFFSICDDWDTGETIKVICHESPSRIQRFIVKLLGSKNNCLIAYFLFRLFKRGHK